MMHRSTGFIQLPMMAYGAIGAALAIATLSGACYIQTTRLDALRQEYEAFKAKVEVLGLAAKKAAAEKEAADLKRKADTDALHQAAVDALNVDIRRLHSDSSRRGRMSLPATATASAAGTCFDPARFTTALRSLDDRILGIAEVGAKAIVDLDAAKRWAQHR